VTNLAGKSFSVLLRDILLTGTNLATSVVVARKLGPHALGLWVILNLIPSYAETLGRLKVDVAAVYYLGRGLYKPGDVVFVLNAIALTSGCLIILPVLFCFDWFSSALFGVDAPSVKVYIYVMLLQAPINFLCVNYSYLHIQREDVGSLNAMVMTRALLSSLLIVIGVLVLNLGLAGLAVGQTAGLICSLSVGLWRYGMPKRGARRIEPTLVWDLLRYGGKLYIAGVGAYFSTYSAQAIVVAFCPPAQVAFFSIAQQLAQLVSRVTDALSTFLYSRVASTLDVAESARLAARAFRIALVVLLPCVIVASLVVAPALLVLYGTSYAPVLIPFWIILPGVTLAAATTTLGTFFQGIGRADLVAKIAFVPLAVQVGLALSLVSRFQIAGAAAGLLLASLASAAIQIVVFLRLTGTSMRDQLLIRREDAETVWHFVAGLLGQIHVKAQR
jgi:O-antigen/teichoic acid export membrane protein